MTNIKDAPSATPVPGDAFPFSRTVNGSEQLLKFDGLYVDPAGFVRGRNAAGYPPKTVSGNYTIAQEDDGQIVSTVDDGNATFTVPELLPGTSVSVVQAGQGKITFSPGAGLTLRSATGAAGITIAQWSVVTFLWIGNGNVLMSGSVT